MADQNVPRDENPHQGASHSFGKNIGVNAEPATTGTTTGRTGRTGTTGGETGAPTTSDRERSIATTRDTSRSSSLGRQPSPGRVYGAGHGSAYGPFTLMRRMTEDMDRLFENLGFGRALGLSPLGASDRDLWSAPAELEATWMPQVETFRRGDKLVVRADLPGMKKEDVHADIEDGILTISGERSSEREDTDDDFYRSERSYGQFYRAIPLPDGVDAEHCDATFKDGVLEIAIPAPKQTQQTGRRIQIK